MSRRTVEVFAPAKVNLCLHVTGRRPDGYHLLDSLVVFAADVGDRLRIEADDDLSLSVTGPAAAGVPADSRNLALKAAERLRALRGVRAGAAITLDKRLPHGAGIGGGSADAAAAIKGLARLWDVPPLTAAEALPLGADVPVCLAGPEPRRMRGVGEIVEPAGSLPALWLVLVNPGVAISTPEVFRVFAEAGHDFRSPLKDVPHAPTFADFRDWLRGRGNDLTECAALLTDAIPAVLDALGASDGCTAANMSGSGSTCWGLFDAEAPARAAAARLSADHPRWWVRPTRVA